MATESSCVSIASMSMLLMIILGLMQVAAAAADNAPSVMNSIALRWNFEDGTSGWGRSSAMEMGVEVNAINGNLHGVVLPNIKSPSAAFVDSPELRIEIQPSERDYLVFRMKYLGQCDLGMISLERNPAETKVDPGIRRERTLFHNPVQIPFKVRANTLDSDLYYIPIWKHVTDTVHRVRFYPCVSVSPKSTSSVSSSSTVKARFGQSFQIDWIAFAKAPVITKVRGCIDRYYQEGDDAARMNCTEHPRRTNGYHLNTAFECFPMDHLPIASTYNCRRDGGGHRISISGKHFGKSDAIITIDGVECLDIVHVAPETELECTLPPASPQWLTYPKSPSSKVRVCNGQLHELFDEVPMLSYAAPVSARPVPIISNVAAHALDVNWRAPSDIWEAMTVTGYRVSWKKCADAAYSTTSNSVVVGNVTSTTILELESATSYQVKVAALTEDYREIGVWQDIDLYGHRGRGVMPDAVVGLDSPSSICITTLANDFIFPQFEARLLTNITAALPSPLTKPTLGPTGEIGDQGHFGLYINGHTNIQNCNASNTCCDGYNSANIGIETASCTYTCSETETRTTTYQNAGTERSPSTNALFAIPFPVKTIRSNSSSSLPAGASSIAPITGACGPALRLTASDSFLTGSAWYPRQMNVREGFETSFVFRISNPSTFCKSMDDAFTNCRSRGGDGFAFVAQNGRAIGIGSGGMELGYGGLKDVLAVEFDTWFNYEQLDVYENHISVHVSGGSGNPVQANHTYSLGSTSNIPDLTDGNHSVKITYTPNVDESMLFAGHFVASTFAGNFFASGDWISGIGMLSVYLDDMDTPVLTVPLRIEKSVELNHGRAWVGFTAATGELAWQTHDILSWKFDSLRQNLVTSEHVEI